MPRVADPADIESILKRIGETGVLPEPYAADPGRLFLAIHDQWVRNGGTVAGKRRNSIRQLDDLLEAAGTRVRSLRSKLNGETRIKREDAAALLETYFSSWRYEAGAGSGGYVPLLAGNPDKADELILSSLFDDQTAILLPKIERNQRRKSKSSEGLPGDSEAFLAGRDAISKNFKISKAIVHVSRVETVAGPTTAAAIRAFCNIMDEYWRIDQKDSIERVLIWIVDPGDRDISSDDSLAAFANAEQLATFFRAVRLMSDPDSENRWQWLAKHAVVLVGSMESAATNRLYKSEFDSALDLVGSQDVARRGVKHSHFLLDAYPPSWLRSLQFAQLYGQNLEKLEQSSFLLYLDVAETQWRYFGYAPADPPILASDGTKSFSKFLQLDSPGPSYDRAVAIVHAAASFRLELNELNINEEERLQAIILLRHLDFAVLRLSEFLNAETLSKHPP